jgi:hypothetical protein
VFRKGLLVSQEGKHGGQRREKFQIEQLYAASGVKGFNVRFHDALEIAGMNIIVSNVQLKSGVRLAFAKVP